MLGKKPINTALSPNTGITDSFIALASLLKPGNYFQQKNSTLKKLKLKELIANYFTSANSRKTAKQNKLDQLVNSIFLTESGRSALYLILKSLDLKEGDEIILQGFTCMVVTNSIVWAGGKPVYVDIDETYNLDAANLKNKITHKTKAVIVQHTFGIAADINAVKEICDEHKLLLIEDCAHALGAEYEGRKVGFWGDFAFYSMGRSKVISAANGGIAICQNEKYLQKMQSEFKAWMEADRKWVCQSLFHPIVSNFSKLTYGIVLGKVAMKISQKLGLINMEVSRMEKHGERPKSFARKFPVALVDLAISQWKMLDKFNKKRREIAEFYFQKLQDVNGLKLTNPAEQTGAIFLRYPIQTKKAKVLLTAARKENIYLGDWYKSVVAPEDIDVKKSIYKNGDCPIAEEICDDIVNLPTHFSLSKKDLIRIVNTVKNVQN